MLCLLYHRYTGEQARASTPQVSDFFAPMCRDERPVMQYIYGNAHS